MKKLVLITAIIILSVSSNLIAQSFGGGFMIAIPKDDFKENVDQLGYGIQGQVTLTTPSKYNPFTVGLSGGFMIYGNEDRRAPLSHTIPDITVDVSRTNSIANLHFLFQVSPFEGQVRPYLEGLAGGSYIFTETNAYKLYNQSLHSSLWQC